MDNDIFFFVNVLNDNNIIEKEDPEFSAKLSQMIVDADINEEEVSIEYSGNPFYIELNGHSDPTDLDNYLLVGYNKFKRTAADSRLDKNKVLQNEVTKRILIARTDLENIKSDRRKDRIKNYVELINLKIIYCDKIAGFLSNIKNEVSKLIRKESGSYTNLTQKEIVILFHHMRNLGYVGKGLDNDEFANLISEITDLSSNRIRQDLSIIQDIYCKDFVSTDYIRIRAALKNLRDKMEVDLKERLKLETEQTKKIPPKQ